MPRQCLIALLAFAVLLAANSASFAGISDAHAKRADETIAKAVAFLKSKQQPDGSWEPKFGPALTALIVGALLEQPQIKRDDPMVKGGIEFVLKHAKPDGSIHAGTLENYSTAICLATLAKVMDDPKVKKVVEGGRKYLRETQWHGQKDPNGKIIDENHPYWGGFGYGKHGRPDASNTQFAIEALISTGSDCKDPEIVMAVDFFSRLQGSKTNKMFADKIVPDGGAIYATSLNKENVGVPQSFAGEVKSEDGTSLLRTYGSMTYAMFKTYVYAKLDKNDPRVADAKKWIANNYTLDRNPGMPDDMKHDGYFYYLVTFARALDANGEESIATADGKKHNWAENLIDKLGSLQKADGSWASGNNRWMENDPVLATAYAMQALGAARH